MSTSTDPLAVGLAPFLAVPQVEIVVPVRDEEAELEANLRRLLGYLAGGFPFSTHITIVDNFSPIWISTCRQT